MNYACDWLGGLSHPWGVRNVRTSITDSTDSRVAGTDRTEAAKKMKLQADSEWYIAAAGCRCHSCVSVYLSLCVKLADCVSCGRDSASADGGSSSGRHADGYKPHPIAVCSGTSALC